jgi:hypothetical protein
VNISEIRGKSSFEQVVIPPETGEPEFENKKKYSHYGMYSSSILIAINSQIQKKP